MKMRMRIHGTDVGIKCGTVMDKMRNFNEFASYLRFCVLDLCFFCNGIQRRSAYYSQHILYNICDVTLHNISYTIFVMLLSNITNIIFT